MQLAVTMESRKKQRIALSTYFFISGFFFSTWASRIPSLKTFFDLNEAELGNLLITMPVSSMIGLPISGWLVSKFESRFPLLASFVLLALGLLGIGFTYNIFTLVISISLFAFSMRIFNIAINTQSLSLQKKFERKIIGSFHGLWSTGGVAGVAVSTLMIKLEIPIFSHILIIVIAGILAAAASFSFLLKKDRSTAGNKLRLGKPDKFILYLGLLVFFAALCEGGMFDWSGVYFRDVVNEDIFTLGYLIFMIFMALSRFYSDKIMERLGMQKTYMISSMFIISGILLMTLFPNFWAALVGFCLVGLGVAAVVPMSFLLAGSSEKYSPGMAISIVTTYAIAGMLLGPPIVGYIAHLFNLRVSFGLFLLAGLMLIPISRQVLKFRESQVSSENT
ncbi:MFS transporter [Salegentibacter sediminis]|uniref:MFS transporter n=1 Tax=Salegentibacter sediminis TaxID=1930251 RepID=UPI001E342EEA|nr:MFS transporter [Salegentibacter sediminis]